LKNKLEVNEIFLNFTSFKILKTFMKKKMDRRFRKMPAVPTANVNKPSTNRKKS
jgi:hypothetical protein